MQQPAWRAEFRSLNRPPRRILHAVQKYAVLARGGGGGPGAAALDLDSEKEPLGPWRDPDVRVGFLVFSPQGRQVWAPSCQRQIAARGRWRASLDIIRTSATEEP